MSECIHIGRCTCEQKGVNDATPPPEAAEGARYREGWCNWQAVSVRLFHHVNATWDEVRDELDRSEARVRELEAFVRASACGSEVTTEDGQHACVYRWDDPILQSRCDRARALLAVRASDARPEGRLRMAAPGAEGQEAM